MASQHRKEKVLSLVPYIGALGGWGLGFKYLYKPFSGSLAKTFGVSGAGVGTAKKAAGASTVAASGAAGGTAKKTVGTASASAVGASSTSTKAAAGGAGGVTAKKAAVSTSAGAGTIGVNAGAGTGKKAM